MSRSRSQRLGKAFQLGLNLFSNLLVGILAGDLLYLYYGGGWTDPNRAILYSELAILWLLIPFSLWRVYYHIKEVDYD